MPLVSVSHKPGYPAELLEAMKRELPEIVSRALDCEEERYDGVLKRGDVVLRSSPDLPVDDAFEVVVDIQTRHYASRAHDLSERTDRVRDQLAQLGVADVGVWIALSVASWSQD